MSILELSAIDLGGKIKAGDIGVLEATNALLEQIERNDTQYNAYISVFADQARAKAGDIQSKITAGELTSPLAGVPVALKDNICTKDLLTSCASKTLSNFYPPYNATIVDRLNDAGSIIIGKLNMDEFAMGNKNETSFYGPVKNPWDITRSSGGSSGGAAAAVAVSEAFYAIGSDTGGSIRQPASFCGVTGLKPTYGTISRYGVVAYASSLDQIGPMARDVRDVAAALDVLSGKDEMDATSVTTDIKGCLASLESADVKGMRIGLPSDYFGEGLGEHVKQSVLDAAKTFESMGATVEYFPMPIVEFAIPTYYIIASAESTSNLSCFDGIKYGYRAEKFDDLVDVYFKSRSEGFGMEVKRRVMLGNFVLSSGYYDAYYNKALQVKALIKKSFDDAFGKYDLILSPAAPTTAPKLGENSNNPLKNYLGDIYTASVNLAGLPAISTPCGFGHEGMPVGVQLIASHFNEKKLLGATYAFQQATDFHTKRPEVLVK